MYSVLMTYRLIFVFLFSSSTRMIGYDGVCNHAPEKQEAYLEEEVAGSQNVLNPSM